MRRARTARVRSNDCVSRILRRCDAHARLTRPGSARRGPKARAIEVEDRLTACALRRADNGVYAVEVLTRSKRDHGAPRRAEPLDAQLLNIGLPRFRALAVAGSDPGALEQQHIGAAGPLREPLKTARIAAVA